MQNQHFICSFVSNLEPLKLGIMKYIAVRDLINDDLFLYRCVDSLSVEDISSFCEKCGDNHISVFEIEEDKIESYHFKQCYHIDTEKKAERLRNMPDKQTSWKDKFIDQLLMMVVMLIIVGTIMLVFYLLFGTIDVFMISCIAIWIGGLCWKQLFG